MIGTPLYLTVCSVDFACDEVMSEIEDQREKLLLIHRELMSALQSREEANQEHQNLVKQSKDVQ